MVWQPRQKDLKNYLHFDRSMPVRDLVRYVTNDTLVARHRFFPLIRFHEKWIKFRIDGAKRWKIRPLRYAARRDAAIYAYHRFKLAQAYESELSRRNIGDLPIAYRHLPKSEKGGGKCNIELAKEAFDFIRQLGDADVTVVDISSFFENLDHARIKEKWEQLVDRPLNPAELKVYESLTQYAVVDRHKVFERFELYQKGIGINRIERRKRKLDKMRGEQLRQICSPEEFRNKVCGDDPSYESLIQKNRKPFGIPQGTPISDLIANLYLIDFDQRLSRWVKKRGGKAFRYCDDIIVILPHKKGQIYSLAKDYLQNSIEQHGENLKIQDKKVAVGRFLTAHSGGQIYTQIFGEASKNGLEYLGFEFNGIRVKIKDATLSNAWRKLKKRAYGWARRYVRRHRAKGDAWLRANAPLAFETERIIKIVAVRERDFKKWTFNRYVERSKAAFSDYEVVFDNQTKKYRKSALDTVMQKAFRKTVAIHGAAACAEKGIPL